MKEPTPQQAMGDLEDRTSQAEKRELDLNRRTGLPDDYKAGAYIVRIPYLDARIILRHIDALHGGINKLAEQIPNMSGEPLKAAVGLVKLYKPDHPNLQAASEEAAKEETKTTKKGKEKT